MKLYSYYRSTAAYRVRIALHYKQLSFDYIPVNLLQREQLGKDYLQHNPQGRVPMLDDNGFEISQSLAILDYLEEKQPTPSLYPKHIKHRAYVRSIANMISCDMHPVNNVGVLNYLKQTMGQAEQKVLEWYHHWLQLNFYALENLILSAGLSGQCCFGDEISLADMCLIPQIYNAKRWNFPMNDYPTLMAIDEYCLQLSYVSEAIPEVQPDCPQ